jgi:hypothetical protein
MKLNKKAGSYDDYLRKDCEDKVFFFELVNPNESSSMISEREKKKIIFPPYKSIRLQDRIQVKGKGLVEIRVCSGEGTIYKNDQTPDDKTVKKIERAAFTRGNLVVEGYDKQLLDFMMLSNWNESNPNRVTSAKKIFKLLDPKTSYASSIQAEKKDAEAKHWCLNAKFTEVMAYAKVLGMKNVDMKEEDAIRWDMKIIAERNPAKFLDEMGKDETKRMFVIITAFEMDHLQLKGNSIYWSKNSVSPILTAPTGKDIKAHLVDWTFTQEGQEFYVELQKEVKKEVKEGPSAAPIYTFTGLTDEEANELFVKALEKNVITQNKNWFSFRADKWLGHEQVKKALQTDAEVLELVKAELNK